METEHADYNVSLCTMRCEHIPGILRLQLANNGARIPLDQALQDGFVSCVHNEEYLQTLIAGPVASIVAVDAITQDVMGYSLSVPSSGIAIAVNLNPFLLPFFDRCYTLMQQRCPVGGVTTPFVFGGQLCVASECRGRGLASRILAQQLHAMQGQEFEYGLTEVALSNPRSLRAHLKAGFHEFDRYDALGL